MKQIVSLLFGAFILFPIFLNGQELHHGFGSTYTIAKYPSDTTTVTSRHIGITYAPRLNLLNAGNNLALSIAARPTFAVSPNIFSFRTQLVSYFVALPATVELHYGLGATKPYKGDFGGFVGAGWDYAFSGRFGTDSSGFEAFTGPIGMVGLKSFIAGYLLNLSGWYMFLDDDQRRYWGLRLIVSVGGKINFE